MTEYGTIKLPREEYERHNEQRKANGQTWAEYIDGQEPELRNGAEVDIEGALAEFGDGPTYDDMVAACRKAIRDELPDGAFR